MKSILDDLAKRRSQRQLSLIWGAREPSGLYLPSAIDKWRRQWPAFQYIPAVDAPSDADSEAMFAGRVDQALASHFTDLSGHVLHCCGSPAMVDAVRRTALSAGLHERDFHADVFVPGPAASEASAPAA